MKYLLAERKYRGLNIIVTNIKQLAAYRNLKTPNNISIHTL